MARALKNRAAETVYPVPEPDLTPEDVIARARALRPRLRAEQDEAEARGGYTDGMHQEFLKAGFYRILQPRLFGGYEFDVTTFYKTMLEMATGHPGAGWCLTLCASHPWVVASHWSEEGQRALFGPTGHFAAPHRAPPSGVATPVEGGYRVTGQWDYCSGIPHATHFVGAARDGGSDDKSATLSFVMPKNRNSPCSTIGAATRRWACARLARTASRSRISSSPNPTSPTAMPRGARRRRRRTARPARGCTATRCISAVPRARIKCRW